MSENLITTITTKQDFKNALKQVGIQSTDTCLVHTALSKFNYVPGGPETLVKALEETLNSGTLMMPSQVTTNCDPETWEYPPVRRDLIQVIRDTMPPYNSKTSSVKGLGITPEYFRTLPDVERSTHPYLPLAIWGKNSAAIAKKQPLNMPYGIDSPLDYLYQHDGKVIFFSTDYETCTMLHYAESTINRKIETCSAATNIDENGKTVWTDYQNVDLDSYDDFNDLGTVFEKENLGAWKQVPLANGFVKAIQVRPLINFARKWFKQKDCKFGNSLD